MCDMTTVFDGWKGRSFFSTDSKRHPHVMTFACIHTWIQTQMNHHHHHHHPFSPYHESLEEEEEDEEEGRR